MQGNHFHEGWSNLSTSNYSRSLVSFWYHMLHSFLQLLSYSQHTLALPGLKMSTEKFPQNRVKYIKNGNQEKGRSYGEASLLQELFSMFSKLIGRKSKEENHINKYCARKNSQKQAYHTNVWVCIQTQTQVTGKEVNYFFLNLVRVHVHKCHIYLIDATVWLTDWQMIQRKQANPSVILLFKSCNETEIFTPLHKITAMLRYNTTEKSKVNTHTRHIYCSRI